MGHDGAEADAYLAKLVVGKAEIVGDLFGGLAIDVVPAKRITVTRIAVAEGIGQTGNLEGQGRCGVIQTGRRNCGLLTGSEAAEPSHKVVRTVERTRADLENGFGQGGARQFRSRGGAEAAAEEEPGGTPLEINPFARSIGVGAANAIGQLLPMAAGGGSSSLKELIHL